MSKVYYDKLLILNDIEDLVKKKAHSSEEKEELWNLVDEIVHHKAMDFVLTILDRKHHEEFIEIFHKCPHDEILIFGYLKDKTNSDVESMMKKEFEKITGDIKKLISM